MDLRIATLAEAALNKNGQLFILGTCDKLEAKAFPLAMPVALVLSLEAHPGEIGTHSVTIMLRDSDGKGIGFPDLNGQVEFGANTIGGWLPSRANLVLNVQPLMLKKPGTYQFVVKVDSRVVGEIVFHAVLVNAQQGEAAA